MTIEWSDFLLHLLMGVGSTLGVFAYREAVLLKRAVRMVARELDDYEVRQRVLDERTRYLRDKLDGVETAMGLSITREGGVTDVSASKTTRR